MSVPSDNRHLAAQILEQLAEESLPPAEERSARAHLAECMRCTMELEAFEALFARLGDLPRFAPSAAFADAVMARVQIAPEESSALAWLRRVVPSTRRGWALLASAAVVPALPLIALILLVATQPLLSPTTLWQWAMIRTQASAQTGFAWLFDIAINSGLYGWFASGLTTVQSLPVMALGGAVALLAIAIPLSGWSLVRLTRTPVGSVNHAS